jgi:hypothetical protein
MDAARKNNMLKTLFGIYQQIAVYLFKREIETSEKFLQFLIARFNSDGIVRCKVTNTLDKIKLEVYFSGEYLFSIRTYNDHLFLFLCVGTLNTMTHPGLPGGLAASELCTLINDVCTLGTATITSHLDGNNETSEIVEVAVPFSWRQLNCEYIQDLIKQMQVEQRTSLISAVQGMYQLHEEELLPEMLDGSDGEFDEENFYTDND